MTVRRNQHRDHPVVEAVHREAGEGLRAMREELGLTIAAAAEAMGLSAEHLRLIELNRRRASDEDRVLLARYYRVSPGDIWDFDRLSHFTGQQDDGPA